MVRGVKKTVITAACSLMIACGPQRGDPSEVLDELCGEAAPRQLLGLAPNEHVTEGGGVARWGDRWLFAVTTFATEVTDFSLARFSERDGGYPRISTRVVSVDACGEDQTVVAEGFEAMFTYEARHPFVGCDQQSSQLHVFDPEGRWPSRALDSKWCAHTRFGEALIVMRDDDALVSYRFEGDRMDGEVLLERVANWGPRWSVGQGETISAVTHDGELVMVDPATRAVQVLREGATWIGSVKGGGRYIIWGDGQQWDNARLLDRQHDVDLPMGRWGQRHLAGPSMQPHVAFAITQTEDSTFEETQLITLSDLRERWLEGFWWPYPQTWNGAVILDRVLQDWSLYVLEPDEDEPRLLAENARYAGMQDDVVWFWREALGADGRISTRSLFRIALGDEQAELVSEAVPPHAVYLGADRWAIVEAWPEGGVSTLALFDDETGRSVRVADHVYAGMLGYIAGPWPKTPRIPTSPFTYAVRDPEHARSGIWSFVPRP